MAHVRSTVLLIFGASKCSKHFNVLSPTSLQIVLCKTINSDQLGHFYQAWLSYIYASVMCHCCIQASDRLPVSGPGCNVQGLYSHF